VNSSLRHPYYSSYVEQNYSVRHRRNKAQFSPNVSLRKMSTTIDHRTFAHIGPKFAFFGRTNRRRRKSMTAWRRGGDSNPGHPFGVKLLSRQPCSATPAPLREKRAGQMVNARACRGEVYHFRRKAEICSPRGIGGFYRGGSCEVAARFSRVARMTPDSSVIKLRKPKFPARACNE
jgi:hypothetical protein